MTGFKRTEGAATGCGAFLREVLGRMEEEYPGLVLLGAGGSRGDVAPALGLAEQSLVLMAAGMAYGGKKVVVSACAALLVGRAYEQIRSAVVLPFLSVCLVGCDSEFSSGYAGGK